MTYRLVKKDLNQTLQGWAAQAEIFAPQKCEGYAQFLPWKAGAELLLDEPNNTRFPPKAFFLPQSETLLAYNRKLNQLETPTLQISPRIIFGIRPCDARAVALLDTVFATQENPDPYWQARREQIVLIGLGCNQPATTCFCTSVGSGPFDHTGLDALLTDIGEAYLVEPLTECGEALFAGLPQAEANDEGQARSIQQQAEAGLTPAFATEGLKEHLDQIFDSSLWGEFAQSCLGCGICTFLCPTCFCFDIVDEAQLDERVRNWDTCMFRVYSLEASGHNPRPTRAERTRQRLMHKFSYWIEHANQFGCTGCGRCVRYCPVGLDIRAMLRKAAATQSEVVHAN
jgi:ferredoxin